MFIIILRFRVDVVKKNMKVPSDRLAEHMNERYRQWEKGETWCGDPANVSIILT